MDKNLADNGYNLPPKLPDVPARKKPVLKRKRLQQKQGIRSVLLSTFSWLCEKQARRNILFCNVCQSSLQGGAAHLRRHEVNDRHVRIMRETARIPKIIEHIRQPAAVKEIEEKIAMFAVEHNISFNSLDHLAKLIKSLSTLKKHELEAVTCSRTKATSIVVSRFAPLQKQALANTLRNTYFSILLDETTDV